MPSSVKNGVSAVSQILRNFCHAKTLKIYDIAGDPRFSAGASLFRISQDVFCRKLTTYMLGLRMYVVSFVFLNKDKPSIYVSDNEYFCVESAF